MGVIYEKLVTEDFNLGYGPVQVSMPGGGLATGHKTGIHTFLGATVNVADFGAVADDVTDSGPAIQAAHDALPSTGGVIYVPASSQKYRVATKITLTKPVKIVGAGKGSVLYGRDGISAIIELNAGAAGAVLSHLRLEGSKAAAGGVDQRGVYINGATDVTVQFCDFSGPSNGIGLNFGIDVYSTTSSRARLLFNQFDRPVSSAANGTAILLEFTTFCTVVGNTIDGTAFNAASTAAAAVFLSSAIGGTGCEHNWIAHNTIHDWPQPGIDCNSTTYFQFSGNLGQCRWNVIEDNHVYNINTGVDDEAATGILLVSNTSYNLIRNNKVHDCGGFGICITGTQQGTPAAGQPKLDETPVYNQVVGNWVYENKNDGIRVKGATNTSIKNNFCYENGKRTANTYSNILVTRVGGTSTGNSNLVSGNVGVGATPNSQLHIGALATGTIVEQNHFPLAATYDILDEGTSTLFAILQAADGGWRIGDYMTGKEQTAPAAPGADLYRLFGRDNGAGKTQLCVLFSSGAVQVLATQP
jgi:parallel beta-helix repeat protein